MALVVKYEASSQHYDEHCNGLHLLKNYDDKSNKN